MKEELNKVQNEISDVHSLHDFSYERIFNVYKDGDHYGYNILKAVRIPEDLDPTVFTYVNIVGSMAWTALSFQEYGSIRLWWLICVTNGILNPVLLPEPGTIIKVIKPEYVRDIIEQIKVDTANES